MTRTAYSSRRCAAVWSCCSVEMVSRLWVSESLLSYRAGRCPCCRVTGERRLPSVVVHIVAEVRIFCIVSPKAISSTPSLTRRLCAGFEPLESQFPRLYHAEVQSPIPKPYRSLDREGEKVRTSLLCCYHLYDLTEAH